MSGRLPSLRNPPVGFAHRGARAHAPENTIEAFQLALRLGATGLESDVWLTEDGQAVLDHTGRVGRWPRSSPISRVARDRLPAHVPSLAELYESCGTGFELSLDLKDPAAAPAVLAAARSASPEAEAHLWLCHEDLNVLASWRSLTSAAKLVHSTRLRSLAGGAEAHAATLEAEGVDALNLHHTEWTGGGIALLHRFERMALAWDCQHERILDEMFDAGIDGLYSDHVDRMTDSLARFS